MKSNSQSAFTLVELAIVLMIIGLLIGGILKGQELINNARITSTIRQLKSYEAATTTFRDAYAAWPGDISNPGTRVPDCGATPVSAPCNTGGNADGRLSTASNIELFNFWRHMAKANMISGIDTTAQATFPNFIVGNGLSKIAVWYEGGKNKFYTFNMDSGGGALSGPVAAKIDRKMDDGNALTGSVIGRNDGWANGETSVLCHTSGVYEEAVADDYSCTLYIDTL